jgi:hypothetical protein
LILLLCIVYFKNSTDSEMVRGGTEVVVFL